MYTYQEFLTLDAQQQFDYFMENLALSNKTPEYFVNWNKVFDNVENSREELGVLYDQISKHENIRTAVKTSFINKPSLVSLIPNLLAIRENRLQVLTNNVLKKGESLEYLDLNFKKVDLNDIDKYIDFMNDTGILSMLEEEHITNIHDYMLGIEVGLDSNGRKNRGGSSMESIIENSLLTIFDEENFTIFKEVGAGYLSKETAILIPQGESERRYDFAVFNKVRKEVTLIEVNFYNSGGSKLKSVAGEFTTQHRIFKEHNNDAIKFLWITDGLGWKSSWKPLHDAYHELDNILNLKMVSDGFLEEIIKGDIEQF